MHGHQSPNTTWNIKFLEAWLSGRLVPGEPKRTHLSGKSVSLPSTAWSWRQLVHVSLCTVVPILTPSHLTPHLHTLTLTPSHFHTPPLTVAVRWVTRGAICSWQSQEGRSQETSSTTVTSPNWTEEKYKVLLLTSETLSVKLDYLA